jgi:hypothetical protein
MEHGNQESDEENKEVEEDDGVKFNNRTNAKFQAS